MASESGDSNYEHGSFDTWEDKKKNIFVLTSAGKPIFSRHGDEQEMVTIFGLLQALVSIVQDSGDQIHSIKAGPKRIVYLLKNSLYFVSVSTTGEPEVVLRQQLEFIYNQILFVLTNKVHQMLISNPSRDLRDLLGHDTNKLIQSCCYDDITPPCIVFQSMRGVVMETPLRDDMLMLLRQTVTKSNAAVGVILHEDALMACVPNDKMQVTLSTCDMILLAQFVHNSSSLKSHDQNWVPLCLPQLNAGGYIQAYVSFLRLDDNDSARPLLLTLVLISADSSADDFKLLHSSRLELQAHLKKKDNQERISRTVQLEQIACENYLSSVLGIHFFYKFKPRGNVPTQCLWGSSPYPQELSHTDTTNRIWIQYFRIAACLRSGSSSPECTLVNPSHNEPQTVTASPGSSKRSSTKKTENVAKDEDADLQAEEYVNGGFEQFNSLSLPPSSDHALAYSVMESGAIVVGLATSDSELYITFPGTVGPLDGCALANFLSRSLKKEINIMFQV